MEHNRAAWCYQQRVSAKKMQAAICRSIGAAGVLVCLTYSSADMKEVFNVRSDKLAVEFDREAIREWIKAARALHGGPLPYVYRVDYGAAAGDSRSYQAFLPLSACEAAQAVANWKYGPASYQMLDTENLPIILEGLHIEGSQMSCNRPKGRRAWTISRARRYDTEHLF